MSVWKIIDLIWGLPGRIDDSVAISKWIWALNPSQIIYPAGLVLGTLLFTSEWWLPRLMTLARRGPGKRLALSQVKQSSPRLKNSGQLAAMLPHIQRCRMRLRSYSGLLGGLQIGWQGAIEGGDRVLELIYELSYLAKLLTPLGIPHPDIYGSTGEPDKDIHIRFRIWSTYLAELEVVVRHEDLDGAQRLQPISLGAYLKAEHGAKQSTLEKSDG